MSKIYDAQNSNITFWPNNDYYNFFNSDQFPNSDLNYIVVEYDPTNFDSADPIKIEVRFKQVDQNGEVQTTGKAP